MNKVVFTIKNYKVRVREILVVLVLLLLLLFLTQCTKEKTKEEKIESAVKQTYKFPKQNIKDLQGLLSSGDLCSEVWFEDVDTFIKRLEDQNKVLKKNTSVEGKALYKEQKNLIKALRAFRKKQDDKSIDALEKAFKKYQKVSKKGCKD